MWCSRLQFRLEAVGASRRQIAMQEPDQLGCRLHHAFSSLIRAAFYLRVSFNSKHLRRTGQTFQFVS